MHICSTFFFIRNPLNSLPGLPFYLSEKKNPSGIMLSRVRYSSVFVSPFDQVLHSCLNRHSGRQKETVLAQLLGALWLSAGKDVVTGDQFPIGAPLSTAHRPGIPIADCRTGDNERVAYVWNGRWNLIIVFWSLLREFLPYSALFSHHDVLPIILVTAAHRIGRRTTLPILPGSCNFDAPVHTAHR